MVHFKQQQVIKDGRKDALALLRKYESLGEGAMELASSGGWGNVGVSRTRLGDIGRVIHRALVNCVGGY